MSSKLSRRDVIFGNEAADQLVDPFRRVSPGKFSVDLLDPVFGLKERNLCYLSRIFRRCKFLAETGQMDNVVLHFARQFSPFLSKDLKVSSRENGTREKDVAAPKDFSKSNL